MKTLQPQANWPDLWKQSYSFDLEEVYNHPSNLGYAYAYQVRRDKALRLLTAVLPAPARVLDIAAAQGNFSIALAELGYHVTWNDLRADLEGYVRRKHEFGNLEYRPGNAFELSFDEAFDAVLITEIIEHVAHPDEFLRSVAKLVKPGGYIVMTTPNGAYFRNSLPKFSECRDPSVYEEEQFKPDGDGHIFLLWPDEIEKLALEAGLIIEQQVFFTNPVTNGHLKSSHLLKIFPKAIFDGLEALTQKLPMAIAQRLLLQVGVRFRKGY